MLISCVEEGISFLLDCKQVSPTKAEKETTWGLDFYTADEHASVYGNSYIWVEVSDVLLEVKDYNMPDEYGSTIADLATEYAVVGFRFPLMTSPDQSTYLDNGEVQCNVRVTEERD